MAQARNNFGVQLDAILSAAERKDMREVKRLIQSMGQMLDDSAREQKNILSQFGSFQTTLNEIVAKVRPTQKGIQEASIAASGIRSNAANNQSMLPDDSGSYGLWEAVLATGEVAIPGMAITVAGRMAYVATATDAGRPMTHLYVQGTQSGGILCRAGGTGQALRLLPGVTNGPLYLSTTPGFLTDDPTETTGGTRAIYQPVGQLERDISTAIGATNLCIVSLNIQTAQSVTP